MHESYSNLSDKLADAHSLVDVGALYTHYKNPDKEYEVIALALDEATEQVCVVYKTSHPNSITWTRPLSDWLAQVENEAHEVVTRFTLIEQELEDE